ncbi:MAG: dihydrodipicolinate synthase family protein [Mariniblastus sp.]
MTESSKTPTTQPRSLVTPPRKIMGCSAVLLPFNQDHTVDWASLEQLLKNTFNAGLTPAVNMDTGYANLIDEATRLKVLDLTKTIGAGKKFIAGVFVGDKENASFDPDRYKAGIAQIQSLNGTPIFFQSFGLAGLPDDQLVEAYQQLAKSCDEFLFFELGKMFAPFGEIYSLEVYEQLMKIPNAIGAKHSSLRRELEWQRIELRNRIRPEFKVFTGNDLAIDMVMYGSDYLLGLSAFAPDAFARRDAMWASGDARFYELNDLLQYLGAFAFRAPTSAYKHSAAMFLKLQDTIATNLTHTKSPTRPESDVEVLTSILTDLNRLIEESN